MRRVECSVPRVTSGRYEDIAGKEMYSGIGSSSTRVEKTGLLGSVPGRVKPSLFLSRNLI